VAPFLRYKQFSRREVARKRFTFLNRSREFGETVDWLASGEGLLWKYNLHYFDYLRAYDGLPDALGARLIVEWIAANPAGTAGAWDPFPTSLRVVNWIKFLTACDLGEAEVSRITGSLFEQTLWLEESLETHLLANHYFKNLKCLVFSGLFFEGDDADRWRSNGLARMRDEIEEQLLADGGHFERSPMYHSMILEDCVDLLNVCSGHNDERIRDFAVYLGPVVRKMALFLMALSHPDSKIALFNDAAFGIEPAPSELEAYYERVAGDKLSAGKSRTLSFGDTGYFVMSPFDGDKLIIDCGRVGPDYQPGHSHSDTLSFELSLKGRRVIVDSGCFGYEDGEMRQYNRGNAGHNTVTIDHLNQSEVWRSHRCARRAYPICAALREEADGALQFRGAHDGYHRLRGRPEHQRSVTWANKRLQIQDLVTGRGRHRIELRLHIDPELNVVIEGVRATVSGSDGVIARISLAGDGALEMASGWYCPGFGLKKVCPVLAAVFENVSLPFESGWIIEEVS
jgi:uncharacterized heparinase superfamily protein